MTFSRREKVLLGGVMTLKRLREQDFTYEMSSPLFSFEPFRRRSDLLLVVASFSQRFVVLGPRK